MFTQEEIFELQLMAQAIWDLTGPTCEWELPRPDFSSLVWKVDHTPPPSKKDVDDRIVILREQWLKNTYKRDRSAEYPSFADQFDMLFHHGVDYWKEKIQEVKDKYPKPEE